MFSNYVCREQDEDLEELRISVERLGDMGKSINEELVGQVVEFVINLQNHFTNTILFLKMKIKFGHN